jgi:hypothetical protein
MASEPDIVLSPLGWNVDAGLQHQLLLVELEEYDEPLSVLAQLHARGDDIEHERALTQAIAEGLLETADTQWHDALLSFEKEMGMRGFTQMQRPLLSRTVIHTYLRAALAELTAADLPEPEALELWLQQRVIEALAEALGTRACWNLLQHLREVLVLNDYRKLRRRVSPAQAQKLKKDAGVIKNWAALWLQALTLPQATVLPHAFLDAMRTRAAFTPLAVHETERLIAAVVIA